MNTAQSSYRSDPHAGWEADPRRVMPSVSGVLGRRFGAYLIDLVVISVLVVLLGFAVTLAGFLTFGLGFMLYGILVPATAIGYSALTVGGARQGTVGMRMFDLVAVDSRNGGRLGGLTAGVHALLFYFAAGTMILIVDVLIGLARDDRRLGHDLLTGVTLVRRSGFA